MYTEMYSERLQQVVRVYGPHVYIYRPSDNSKHGINGWVPTQYPLTWID